MIGKAFQYATDRLLMLVSTSYVLRTRVLIDGYKNSTHIEVPGRDQVPIVCVRKAVVEYGHNDSPSREVSLYAYCL